MRSTRLLTAAMLAAPLVAPMAGCAPDQPPPPVQVVDTPFAAPPVKPLPPPDADAGLPPAFNDQPIVRQQLPQEPAYVAAYRSVGKPRLMVFVNRTVTGELVPAKSNAPALSAVKVDDYNGSATVTLRPGQYDEVAAKTIDYELIENLLTDELSADGQVIVMSPIAARQRLTDAEVADLQAGRPQMLGELAAKLNCQVLVQVTARPSRQTAQGLGVRLVAQALNTQGGQAIGFAAVDVPPPLTKPQLNQYERFVAAKLMDGMAASWRADGNAAGQPPMPLSSPPPAAPPQPMAPPPLPAQPLIPATPSTMPSDLPPAP